MIKAATWPEIEFVARNMRERDRLEICALSNSDDPVVAVSHLKTLPYFGAIARKDEPIAAVGAVYLWPGSVSAFMFATDRWSEVATQTTRWAKKVLIPSLYRQGIHRMQCYSMVGHKEAHRWLRYFGAKSRREPAYGKNHEDFLYFVLDRKGMERVTSTQN